MVSHAEQNLFEQVLEGDVILLFIGFLGSMFEHVNCLQQTMLF